jgi:glycosyltransferase involved in cell wall biosynthesis
MNIASKLQNLRIVIVTHEYATGPSHALEKYLQGKTSKLAFIAHPFIFAKEKRSHMRIDGSKESFFPWHVPVQSLNLIKDVLLTLWWCLRFGFIDLYVGVDNINACVGIVLQKSGLVKKTVFYTIDYIPNRFDNPFLNAVYHRLDAFAVKNVDVVWNLSSIMERERAKIGLSSLKIRQKQKIVPMGTDATVRPFPFANIKRYHMAHMGHLTKKQGVQLVIEAIPFIVKRLPQFHFDVIGGGPMERELKMRVNQLRINRLVTFYGFIENHDDVESLLATCALAVAPYVDSPDNFVRFTDPGKVKAYLAVGLPIVITKVPEVWRVIVREKAGIAVSDSPHALAEAIVRLLSGDKQLRAFRLGAIQLGKKYTWDKIFAKALLSTL